MSEVELLKPHTTNHTGKSKQFTLEQTFLLHVHDITFNDATAGSESPNFSAKEGIAENTIKNSFMRHS
jgi:hypothetical protein